ncbi:heterokaryon incompatibility protein-domain-containing protein, partial [Echria macrotheca]
MIDKAKSWLLQCLEHHQCGAPLPFFDNAGNGLPTRLLDVSTRPDTPSSHIRLVNSNDISSSGQGDDEPLVYFALSHCWGPEGIPGAGKTTLSSLPQRQTAIDIDTLPLNFQHAIRITRDFGADYLWIDALCIIQDSVKDWLEEGARMGAVYSNACLTLAAASSGKAADGFLGHGPVSTPRKHIPLRLDTTGLQEPELGPVDVLLYSHRSLSVFEPKFLDKLKRGTHLLAQRAWCLQENVMSGRVLHFVAGGELVWECREGLRNEFLDFSYGDEIWSAIVPKIASLRPACVQLGHMLTGELDALDLWYNHVVPDFTSRSITFDSDRLAAVGSIARAVAWKCGWTGEDYIAGAWSKDLGRSLAWKMAEFNAYDKHKCGNTTQNTTGSSQAKSTEWRNPSWSWVSARAPVVFEM